MVKYLEFSLWFWTLEKKTSCITRKCLKKEASLNNVWRKSHFRLDLGIQIHSLALHCGNCFALEITVKVIKERKQNKDKLNRISNYKHAWVSTRGWLCLGERGALGPEDWIMWGFTVYSSQKEVFNLTIENTTKTQNLITFLCLVWISDTKDKTNLLVTFNWDVTTL